MGLVMLEVFSSVPGQKPLNLPWPARFLPQTQAPERKDSFAMVGSAAFVKKHVTPTENLHH
jgi:hypothetical protein